MIVDIAFAVVPSILGFGAAGLIGSTAIRTAKDVMNSISVLRTVGSGMAIAGKGLNVGRKWIAEKLQQSDHGILRVVGNALTPVQWAKSKLKKNNQDTQGKQEGQGGRGGGRPPTPPDRKSDKNQDRKIILPEDLLKSGELSLEEYLKLLKKEK
ncbi:MAG: hypothetical protein ACO2PP_04185 [Thermocrinis sp.]|jgi:hypothetical protein|uniref:hypothetical protein n=1 Tax=Thermocrinis sp. TaxID=2024383 RepID=UPI003C121C16